MNAQYFDRARAALRSGDYSAAASMFLACKEPGEVAGEVDHLRGNALMKLGLYADAEAAYTEALEDAAYGKAGALLTNRGKAQAARGDYEAAVESFTAATKDASYATPYKAYLGLANALLKLDRVTDAGVAFRSAAIDGANPAPASALASLGDCFVKLGRPADAVESYLTALDYVSPHDDPRAIEAGLGIAYAAAGRSNDAVDAFNRATSDGIYQLDSDQQAAFEQAKEDVANRAAIVAQRQAAAPAAGYGAPQPVDPLDPTGSTGGFMPDPSDTGFFTMTESEMIQQDRRETKIRRKKRHTGLKVFIVLLLLIIIAAGGLGFAYTRGFGFPSQQDAISGLLQAVNSGEDANQYLSPNLSDDAKSMITSSLEGLGDATATVTGLDAGMTESDATVDVTMPQGGTVTYQVHFVRSSNHIGWAVESLTMDFGTDDQQAVDTTGTAADATGTDTGSLSTDLDSTDVAPDATGTDDSSSTDQSADDTAGATDGDAADGTADTM